MAVGYIETTFYGDNKTPIGTAKVPDTPGGWWVVGVRQDIHQSWERPFFVELVANDSHQFDGRLMFYDIGETFCHFEDKKDWLPGASDMGVPPLLMGMLGLPAMPAMPPMPMPRMPLPHTGRPDRPFPGIGAYLDECAAKMMDTDEQGNRMPFRLLSERLAFGTEEDARKAEQSELDTLRLDFAPMSGRVLNYVPNKAMRRTVMREYSCKDRAGRDRIVFVGALMRGYDLLVFSSRTGITSLPGGGYEFGQAPLGSAEFYQVMWSPVRRFGGSCYADDDIDEFRRHILWMYSSAKFDDAVLDEIERREKAFRDADSEAHQRDIEGLRQLNKEMREDSRRKDAIREWEDAKRRQRKIDSDRRIREGWSAAIRGVEQYVGPDGRMIEVPVRGIGYRAYYDRLSGTVIHTDRYMDGLEELPEWKW